MADYYNNVIHKIDRRGKMLVVKDMTNDEWDISDYNNYKFEFVEYDTKSNKAVKRFSFFIDADEINALFATVIAGNYTKIYKDPKNKNDNNNGWHKFYAGSAKNGQAEVMKDGDMKKLINGPESRILTTGLNDSGYFIIKIDIAKGKVGDRGAITPAGGSVDSISFGISLTEAVTLAKTIDTYTIAKKTIGVSNYTKHKKENQREAS